MAISENTTVAPDVQDDERARMIAAMRSMRRHLAEAVEMLLIGLDELDGDADLEEDDPGEDGADHEPDESGIADQDALALDQRDEPSLGWTTSMNQTTRMPPLTGRYAWAVEDGEQGDDNGIGDAGGIGFDDESYLGYSVPGGIVDAEGPDDNGIADSGGEQEVIGEIVAREGYRLDRERRAQQAGRVYVGEMSTAGFKPFGA